MSGEMRSSNVPMGPFTLTVPGRMSTSTPAGTGMGFLPIRLMIHQT